MPVEFNQHPDDIVADYLFELEEAHPDPASWPCPTVQQIAEATGLAMNTVRRQLKRLRADGDIDGRFRLIDRDGIIYSRGAE